MSEMGDHDAVPRSVGRARRPRPDSAEGRRRSPAGHGVTATEAEQSRHRGLAWWRLRSWSKDLDTLTRLHKGLRAMDADAEQELLAEQELPAAEAEHLHPEPGEPWEPDPAIAAIKETFRYVADA